jgi:putative nucleotidyltransferase with HDIG domain
MLDASGVELLLSTVSDQLVTEGLSAVVMTVVDGGAAAAVVVAGGGELELDRDALCRHQRQALSAAGRVPPESNAWRFELRSVAGPAPLPPTTITTRLALASGDWALVFSILSHADGAVGRVMDRLELAAVEAQRLATLAFARRALARRLLRPGEDEHPELETHSMSVSRLSFAMARRLEWSAEDCELAALAGLLHDVGMRDIEYDSLYRHPSPGPAERRLYQLHVHAGERIVRGVSLDDVAGAIRHHHERWDGKGYPDRLAGPEIPKLARLVHVAEVYDVLVSATSYRPAVAPDRALAVMRAASGHQFDPEMVETLALVI